MKHEHGPIEDDKRVQLWESRATAFGALLMAAVVIAGLIGLWGGGVLGNATVTDSDHDLTVEYDRFVRYFGQTFAALNHAQPHRTAHRAESISADFRAVGSPQPSTAGRRVPVGVAGR